MLELKLNFAQFYIATPFPGSEFYRIVKENNWLIKDDMKDIHQGSVGISYPDFTEKQMQRERINAYLKFYLRPHSIYSNIIARSPKVLLRIPMQFLRFATWAVK